MNLQKVILPALLLLLSLIGSSQIALSKFRIQPMATLGYVWGGGFSIGPNLDLGYQIFEFSNTPVFGGFNLGVIWFKSPSFIKNESWFRVVSLSTSFEYKEIARVQVGLAKTYTSWGVNNINKESSKSPGLNIEIAFSQPNFYHAWVGYQFFKVNNRCMGLDFKRGHHFFAGYSYPYQFAKQPDQESAE